MYATRAGLIRDLDGDDQPVAVEIIVQDDAPRDTGLLDQWGDPIRFFPSRIPFGFVGRNHGR